MACWWNITSVKHEELIEVQTGDGEAKHLSGVVVVANERSTQSTSDPGHRGSFSPPLGEYCSWGLANTAAQIALMRLRHSSQNLRSSLEVPRE